MVKPYPCNSKGWVSVGNVDIHQVWDTRSESIADRSIEDEWRDGLER